MNTKVRLLYRGLGERINRPGRESGSSRMTIARLRLSGYRKSFLALIMVRTSSASSNLYSSVFCSFK